MRYESWYRLPPGRVTVAFCLFAGLALGTAMDVYAEEPLESVPKVQGAIEILYGQAEFWDANNRGDLSRNALNRILLSDPGDWNARYQLGLSYAKENDLVAAGVVLRELYANQMGKEYADQLASEIKSRSFDEHVVAKARSLVEGNRQEEALEIYQGLFTGREPSGPMAIEMYYAMSAVEQFRDTAIAGLERMVDKQPGNRQASLALARILTYDESTRRRGLDMLYHLEGESGSSEALAEDRRNALLWLSASPHDLNLYERYLKIHPEDDEVRKKHSQLMTSVDPSTPEGQIAIGYRYLNEGKLVQAEQAFKQAMAQNPGEVDALAGLSIIRHRQGHHQQAMTYLQQADRQGADVRSKFPELWKSVRFWYQLGVAEEFLDQSRPQDARRTLDSISAADSRQQLELSLMQYKAELSSGDTLKAESWLRESIRTDISDERALMALLDLYLDGRNLTGLSTVINQFESQFAERSVSLNLQSKLHRCKAILAESRNENQLAGELYRKGIQLDTENVWIRLDYARFLARTRGKAAGADVAEQIPVSGVSRNEGPFAKALYFNEHEQWSAVIRNLQRIDANFQTENAGRILKEALFRQSLETILSAGELRGGRSVEEDLLRLYESETSIQDRAVFVADAMSKLGLHTAATAVARQALAYKGDALSVKGRLSLIRLMIDSGAADTAARFLADLERMPAQKAEDAVHITEVRLRIEQHFALENIQSKNYRKAENYLTSAYKLDPDNSVTLRLRGQLAREEGRLNESVKLYRQAIKADPKDLWAIKGAVGSAIVGGDLKTARTVVQGALVELPEEPEIYELISQVAQSANDAELAIEAMAYSRKLKRKQ